MELKTFYLQRCIQIHRPITSIIEHPLQLILSGLRLRFCSNNFLTAKSEKFTVSSSFLYPIFPSSIISLLLRETYHNLSYYPSNISRLDHIFITSNPSVSFVILQRNTGTHLLNLAYRYIHARGPTQVEFKKKESCLDSIHPKPCTRCPSLLFD